MTETNLSGYMYLIHKIKLYPNFGNLKFNNSTNSYLHYNQYIIIIYNLDWKNPNYRYYYYYTMHIINFRIDTLSKLLSVISNSEILSS